MTKYHVIAAVLAGVAVALSTPEVSTVIAHYTFPGCSQALALALSAALAKLNLAPKAPDAPADGGGA